MIDAYYRDWCAKVSSDRLIDEWEKLRNPHWTPSEITETQAPPESILKNKRKLEILLRNEIFKLIRSLANRSLDDISEFLQPPSDFYFETLTESNLKMALEEYFTNHSRLCTDSKARAPKNSLFKP